MTDAEMMKWLKRCEGFHTHPYLDTSHKVTIGYGRNLDSNGITLDEANYMLKNDLEIVKRDLERLPWFERQPEGIKDALTNMCFNLGLQELLAFDDMINAILAKNYTEAAREALDSLWARQVGQRAKDIAVMISEAK